MAFCTKCSAALPEDQFGPFCPDCLHALRQEQEEKSAKEKSNRRASALLIGAFILVGIGIYLFVNFSAAHKQLAARDAAVAFFEEASQSAGVHYATLAEAFYGPNPVGTIAIVVFYADTQQTLEAALDAGEATCVFITVDPDMHCEMRIPDDSPNEFLAPFAKPDTEEDLAL